MKEVWDEWKNAPSIQGTQRQKQSLFVYTT